MLRGAVVIVAGENRFDSVLGRVLRDERGAIAEALQIVEPGMVGLPDIDARPGHLVAARIGYLARHPQGKARGAHSVQDTRIGRALLKERAQNIARRGLSSLRFAVLPGGQQLRLRQGDGREQQSSTNAVFDDFAARQADSFHKSLRPKVYHCSKLRPCSASPPSCSSRSSASR